MSFLSSLVSGLFGGLLGGLFGSPQPPAPQPMPVQPTVDDTRQAEEDIARLRRRRGRQSTFLTGTFGRPSVPAGASGLGASGASPPAAGSTYGLGSGFGGSSRQMNE